MELDELLLLVKAEAVGEHRQPNIELKESWTKDNGRKISALGNRTDEEPKWLCVGIADKGTLVGHDEKWARANEQIISQQVNQFLDPSQACTGITCHDLDGQWIIVLKIENPGVVVKWDGAAYKGAGTTVQVMDAAQVMELTVRLPGLSDYSAQPWIGPSTPELVIPFAKHLFSRRPELARGIHGEEQAVEFLGELGIKDTNVSRILFGSCPYRVIYYDDSERVIENSTGFGVANLLSDNFLESIESWTSDQTGVPSPVYPPRALREAIANAVAHAAYFENDGEITIEAFKDRLSISNLCVRESEYFANKWFSRSHKTINRLLMECLRFSGHVDELGLGKNVIFVESLRNGKRPPLVNVEPGHRYDRWRLFIYGGHSNETQLRLLQRCRQTYPDERKALIASALVLWRDQQVAEIRKFIDGESLPLFAEVLADHHGPIFYYEEEDRIILRRWAGVLIGEGKDSKQLSIPEEERLRDLAYELRSKYRGGYITPKELRDLAGMGHTAAEKVLISQLFRKWKSAGVVESVRKGLYRFVPRESKTADITKILEALSGKTGVKGS